MPGQRALIGEGVERALGHLSQEGFGCRSRGDVGLPLLLLLLPGGLFSLEPAHPRREFGVLLFKRGRLRIERGRLRLERGDFLSVVGPSRRGGDRDHGGRRGGQQGFPVHSRLHFGWARRSAGIHTCGNSTIVPTACELLIVDSLAMMSRIVKPLNSANATCVERYLRKIAQTRQKFKQINRTIKSMPFFDV